jgi:membrane protein
MTLRRGRLSAPASGGIDENGDGKEGASGDAGDRERWRRGRVPRAGRAVAAARFSDRTERAGGNARVPPDSIGPSVADRLPRLDAGKQNRLLRFAFAPLGKPGRMANQHRQAAVKNLVRLWVDLFKRHNLLTYASAIAFQAFVALVAFALLFVGVLGAIGHQEVWSDLIAPQIAPKVLPSVFAGIDETVLHIFGSNSAGLIAFAAVLTIWEISGVVRACMGAFATIYEADENRPWWIRFPLSIGIALVLTVAIVGAVLLATAARSAVHGSWGIPFAILRWLAAVAVTIGAFGVLVRFAPVQPRTTRWASGGAALVVLAWLIQSALFEIYLRTFADYTSAAGSLLGVYFLTTYLYVAAIVLLVGVELDEQLRQSVSEGQERGILQLVREVL